jgi:sugar/nucleoside kinase (ribokinase family)
MTILLAGLCTIDVVQRVREFPVPGEKVQSLSASVAAGGPATNAAVTVAALGGEATLLTVLGAHPLAALARADLESCGVQVVDVHPQHPDPPALSAVTVRAGDGERTVVSRNAAGHFSGKVLSLSAQLGHLSGRVPAVLVDGHHPELALGVAKWAREQGIPVVLDAGSWKPVFEELLPLVDIAACSAGFRTPGASLHERGVPTVITTAGPEPVRWSTKSASGEVAVPRVTAVDTLGAGDVWHGAFAFNVGKLDLPELIGFANEVAAERVRHAGPRAWPAAVGNRGMGVR